MRQILKYIFHNIFCSILLTCGLHRLLQNRSPNKRLIIMYHGVRSGTRSINGRHVTATMFEKQLKYFKKRFDIVSLTELCEMKIKGIVPKKHTIALTFDDGFLNNLNVAVPLLAKYNIPATFFICTAGITDSSYAHPTDRVDLIRVASKPEEIHFGGETFHRKGHRVVDKKGRHAYDYINGLTFEKWLTANNELASQLNESILGKNKELYQLMHESDVMALRNYNFIKAGSHGHHHISLSKLTPGEIRDQLLQSKKTLETYAPVDSIAFPYGAYNESTIAIAKEIGYKYLIAGGDVNPPFERDVFPRIGVLDGAGFPYTMLMISNGFKRFGF